MPKFKVSVDRTGYSSLEIEVEAENEAEAKNLAMDEAGNHSFSEHDADYEADHVEEIVEEPMSDSDGCAMPDDILAAIAKSDEMVLDDVVHDLVSGRASDVNNEGWQGQIDFITENCGRKEAIKVIRAALDLNQS